MTDCNHPHPLNAPGDFYVVHGCCTSCNAPFEEAPGMFKYDGDCHCYVAKQPATQKDVDQALRATWAAELQCIRYRGSEADIVRRLAEMGSPDQCDQAIVHDIPMVFRNHVTFDCLSSDQSSSQQLASDFVDFQSAQSSEVRAFRFKPAVVYDDRVLIEFAWYQDNFHPVSFAVNERQCHVSVELPGSRAVAMMLHDWISAEHPQEDVRWYSEADWNEAGNWQVTPW
jgi:hypothetical protein